MLQNNTKAIETVLSLSGEKIYSILCEKEISNYGDGKLADLFINTPDEILGSLFNSDLDLELEKMLIMNPDGIVAGLYALAKVIGKKEATIILSKGDSVKLLKESAEKLNFDLHIEIAEFVDVRKYRRYAKAHLVALSALADVITGEEEKTVIAFRSELKEMDYHTSLSDIIGKEYKAVLFKHSYYLPDDLEGLCGKDIPFGSGVIKCISKEECIVKHAKEQILSFRQKSCSTCTFCREGLYQMYGILDDITNAKAKKNDIELIQEIAEAVLTQTNCSLGKAAALLILSLIQNFSDELDSHTKKKICPAGSCKAFQSIYIDPIMCKGCGDCIDICPKNCIEGKRGYISMIDDFYCTKCGKCILACNEGAIKNTSGRLPKMPTKLTKVGRFKK